MRGAAEHLAREGRLTRVTSELYFATTELDALEKRLRAYLEAHGAIDPTAYKELTGQTRKHTVPLMEYFDARRVTVRRGNLRHLRSGGVRPPRSAQPRSPAARGDSTQDSH